MRAYLANRMTNMPQFNYPWFDRVAAELRSWGIDIRSPAEMDDPETRRMALLSPDGSPGSGVANGETWGDFLARDVKLIADGDDDGPIDAVIVGPDWAQSSGAKLETFVAAQLGKPVLRYPSLERVEPEELAAVWSNGFVNYKVPA